MLIVPQNETIFKNCQSLFSGKNKKILSVFPAVYAQRVVKVKLILPTHAVNFYEIKNNITAFSFT